MEEEKYIDYKGLSRFYYLLSLIIAKKQDVYSKILIDNIIGDLGNILEAIEGEHYTQEEIDNAQEGDDAYGKTIDDWKIEPLEAIPHTVESLINTKIDKTETYTKEEILELLDLIDLKKVNLEDLVAVAFSGDYDDLINKPIIGNGNLKLSINNTLLGNFSANSTENLSLNLSIPTLDSNGKIIGQYLPSYVDNIIEGYLYNNNFYLDSEHTKLVVGESNKIYTDIDTNLTYRWSGTKFVEISKSLALGETSSTAYAGDKGKNLRIDFDNHASNDVIHITSAERASWNSKQNTISDLATIRSNASEGHTAYGWGDHSKAGYVKSSGVTSVAMTVPIGLSISGSPITSTGTLALSFANGYSIPTTAKLGNWDTAYGWGNHANAGYVKSSGITKISTTDGVVGGDITTTGTIKANLASYTKNVSDIGGKLYAVQLDKSGRLAVNVPWTDHYAWSDITGKPSSYYTLPLAANGTRGGVLIGFTTNAANRNYAVLLSGEKMYVNVPWTDNNSTYPLAIKDISRSGTTFTATRYDGTTFTFTQQDNNTTYSAGTGLSLSGTKFSLALTKSLVTDALGYTPPTLDTNTTYSAGSGLSLSGTTFSLALTKALVTAALGYTPPTQDTNTWKPANTSLEGYAPKLTTGGGTIATQKSEYVLTFKNGTDAAPVWRLLPANAYLNSTYTVNNGTLNLLASGTTKTTFTANQSTTSTFNIATGSANGTISVGGTDVVVKGLGSSAYYDSTAVSAWNANGYYGTCTTAGETTEKTVNISNFTLNTNRQVSVLFTNGFTVRNPTLNVSNTGAHAIKIYGSAIPMGKVDNNTILTMIYDGTNYNVISIEPQAVPTSNAIDLGLPSGLLWCDHNVGASKPEEEGFFFSWGNVTGRNLNSTGDYNFGTNVRSEPYISSSGATITGNISTDNTYDMAHANMGAPWRLPSSTEFQELYNYCTKEKVTQNGMNGIRFISSINGNSIFFPAAGSYFRTLNETKGSSGEYWSSSIYSTDAAYNLFFDLSKNTIYPRLYGTRSYGNNVRAVQ